MKPDPVLDAAANASAAIVVGMAIGGILLFAVLFVWETISDMVWCNQDDISDE